MDWLDLLAIQGTIKSLLQDHSSKALILWCSAFFIVQLSYPYSSVQLLSRVQLFGTTACQVFMSITNYQSLLKLMSIKLVMPSNHLILPLSSPSPPTFNLSQYRVLFQWVTSSHKGGQIIGLSAFASVLPMNSQDWSPLGWTYWISLQCKGLSRVFSDTTIQKHQFFGAQLSF